MEKIDRIIVLGGGTSGLITAMMMKTQFPHKDVTVIESSEVGVIGVGEGATEHWKYFCDFVGLNLHDTLVECDATLKAGIKFTNWGVPDYYHATCEPYAQTAGDYSVVYAQMIAQGMGPLDIIFNRRCVNNEIPTDWVEGIAPCPVNQFHFNTFSTIAYLHKECAARNITIIDDKIVDVDIDQNGYVTALHGTASTYNAEFFIDCSGFAKVIMKKLGAQWVSYKDNLWLNSAIAFPTEDTDQYNTCTTATGMDYGWMWNTPVRGRWGNGYVFCDKYIDFDQAQAEVELKLGRKIEIAKKIKFEAGKLDRGWIKNCVAIGLCSSFIEPLESSAISQTVLQSFLILNLLPSWVNSNDEVSQLYNEKFDSLCENILDFIAVHYITPREDTQFWLELKTKRNEWIPLSLKSQLDKWSKRLPIAVDFSQKYVLFSAANWIVTLHGLGLIDLNTVQREQDLISPDIKKKSAEIIDFNKTIESTILHMPHKEALTQFINNFVSYKNTHGI